MKSKGKKLVWLYALMLCICILTCAVICYGRLFKQNPTVPEQYAEEVIDIDLDSALVPAGDAQ